MLPWDEWGPTTDSYNGKTGIYDGYLEVPASMVC